MEALNIGYAAPWNMRSAIAQSASEVAFELARRGHLVTVLRTEVGDALALPVRPAPGPIHHLNDYPPRELQDRFDVVVAHIGDHYGFHGALPERLRDTVMLGIFHDAWLADLAIGAVKGDEAAIRALLRETYGSDTWPAGTPFFLDMAEAVRQRPLIEWFARRTSAAVAHAEHYAQRLRDSCLGSVTVIPLAFTVPGLPPAPAPWDHLTIGVVGVPNTNKRIDQLLMAIAASPILRSRCRVRIVGEASDEDRRKLTWLATSAGVEPPEFTGWATDRELRWHLRDVDVMSCLRNPVLEGASASLIVAQLAGRPTLVTRHGCYAEAPADTVLACSPEHEALDAMRHLERVIDDPALRSDIGNRARAFAASRHNPAAYVDRLEPLLYDLVARRPVELAMRQLTDTLIEFGLPADDPSVARAELSLASLTASPDHR